MILPMWLLAPVVAGFGWVVWSVDGFGVGSVGSAAGGPSPAASATATSAGRMTRSRRR